MSISLSTFLNSIERRALYKDFSILIILGIFLFDKAHTQIAIDFLSNSDFHPQFNNAL